MFEFTPCDCLKAASEQHFCLLFLTSVMFGPATSRGYLEKLTQLASLSVDVLWLAQAK